MNNHSQTLGGTLRPLFSCASEAFVVSAGVILAITGFAKIWSAFGNSKALAVVDPIVGMEFGSLMLIAGLVEVVIALFCWFSAQRGTKYLLLAWLAAMLTAYRIAIWYVGWRLPCSCLGSLTDSLPISPQFADDMMKVLLAYIGIGAFLMYGIYSVHHRRSNAS